MDLELLKRGLDFSKRKKKWIIVLGLIGFSSYGAYKLYHTPSVARKRKRIVKLLGALISLAEMISDSAETVTVVSKDLKKFLQSDSDEVPNSLKQLSKIARSEEFSQSLIRVSEAVTVGIFRGYRSENRSEIEEVGSSGLSDRVLNKLMSTAGTGFVSVVVGSFARNLVVGLYSNSQSHETLNGGNHSGLASVKSNSLVLPRWVEVIYDDKCKLLLAECIQTFVSTAVAVYLDKTMNINFYDEMFSGLTNPKHQDKVRDMLVSLCNGAVETIIKTSHKVMTAPKENSEMSPNSSFSIDDQSETFDHAISDISVQELSSRKRRSSIDLQNNGWVSSVSSTLAVPSNRRFVLDVTGRVTFETIRSIMEFLIWKVVEGLKGSLNVIHEDVVKRGLDVIRYVGARSYVILTVCLALFLHLVGSTQVLLPA